MPKTDGDERMRSRTPGRWKSPLTEVPPGKRAYHRPILTPKAGSPEDTEISLLPRGDVEECHSMETFRDVSGTTGSQPMTDPPRDDGAPDPDRLVRSRTTATTGTTATSATHDSYGVSSRFRQQDDFHLSFESYSDWEAVHYTYTRRRPVYLYTEGEDIAASMECPSISSFDSDDLIVMDYNSSSHRVL